MTPQPQASNPDDEFIITRKEVWASYIAPMPQKIKDNVLSHPHPPADAPEKSGLDNWKYEDVMQEISDAFDRGYAACQSEHTVIIAQAKKEERERVLDKIEEISKVTGFHLTTDRLAFQALLKSLRSNPENSSEQQGGSR